jgi:hypothetical protein
MPMRYQTFARFIVTEMKEGRREDDILRYATKTKK